MSDNGKIFAPGIISVTPADLSNSSFRGSKLMKRYDSIYRATLAKWGEEAQYDQAVEECAELITALKHYKRDKIGRDQVIDELADVALMVGQLSFMFGEEQVRQAVEKKLAKLEQLLNK
jgi:NTP pyrophosphatase (non-canonical NTP hydrolase)